MISLLTVFRRRDLTFQVDNIIDGDDIDVENIIDGDDIDLHVNCVL